MIYGSSPSSSAEAPEERLGSSRCGTSRLRDFLFIKFRPADIPVWLNASRERLLRAPRPLRLRLRCQIQKRCRSASGCVASLHNPRLTDAVHSLQAGKTVDILRCAAESTDLLPPSALLRPLRGLQLPRPPALRLAYYRLPPVIVLPLWFFVVVVVVVLMLGIAFNQKGGAGVVVILLFVLIYNNRKDTASLYLYVILLLYGEMILMMIPA